MLNVLNLTATGRTLTPTAARQSTFFMYPGYRVETEGIRSWHIVATLGNLFVGLKAKGWKTL